MGHGSFPDVDGYNDYSAVELHTCLTDGRLAVYGAPATADLPAQTYRYVWVPAFTLHLVIRDHGGAANEHEWTKLPPLANCRYCHQPFARCFNMAVGLDSMHLLWFGMGNRFTDTPTPPTCAICAKVYSGDSAMDPPPSTHHPAPTCYDGTCVGGEPITFFTVADAHRRTALPVRPPSWRLLRDLPFRSMPLTERPGEPRLLEICQRLARPHMPHLLGLVLRQLWVHFRVLG